MTGLALKTLTEVFLVQNKSPLSQVFLAVVFYGLDNLPSLWLVSALLGPADHPADRD